MLVIEIDGVDFQAAQGFLGDFPDVVGMAVEGAPFAAFLGIAFPSEFGGDGNFAVELRERFAD